MTSANISNLFVQVTPNVPMETQGSSTEAKTDFTNLMASKVNPAPESEIVTTVTQNFSKVDASSVSSEAKRSQIKESSSVEEETVSGDLEKTAKAVEKLDSDVKKAIADELNVSEEDVEKAMEVLGLTVLDLVDKNNLATLIATVTGVENNVSVLLNDSFSTLSDKIVNLTNNMLEDLSMTLEEVQNVLGEMENVKDFNSVLEVTAENDSQIDVLEDDGFVDTEAASENVANVETSVETNIMSEDTFVNRNTELDDSKDAVNWESKSLEAGSKMPAKTEARESGSETNLNSNGKKTFEQKDVATTEENFSVVSNNENKTFFDSVNDVVEIPDSEPVNTQQIIDQIVEQAKVVNTTENTTLEMILNPEGLGKVYMEITQEKGGEITAKFVTTNEAVKEALENQMATLRNDLNSSTSKVTSVEVSVATHEFEQNLEQGANRQQEEAARQQAENNSKRRTSINLNNLDELSGLMSEEEQLVAQIMRDNGNSVNYEV